MKNGTAESYACFVRNWWKWEGGLRVPGPGRRKYIARRCTFAEARAVCDAYNDTHEPGPLSRKAELEREA